MILLIGLSVCLYMLLVCPSILLFIRLSVHEHACVCLYIRMYVCMHAHACVCMFQVIMKHTYFHPS